MNFKNLLVLICAFFCVSAFANTVTLNSLSKDDVNTLLKGNTLTVGPGVYVKDKFTSDIVKVFFAQDGSLKGKMASGKTDTGTWTVKDDGTFCTTWKKWGDFCQYVYPLKDHYIFITPDQDKLVVISKNKISKAAQ